MAMLFFWFQIVPLRANPFNEHQLSPVVSGHTYGVGSGQQC